MCTDQKNYIKYVGCPKSNEKNLRCPKSNEKNLRTDTQLYLSECQNERVEWFNTSTMEFMDC